MDLPLGMLGVAGRERRENSEAGRGLLAALLLSKGNGSGVGNGGGERGLDFSSSVEAKGRF